MVLLKKEETYEGKVERVAKVISQTPEGQMTPEGTKALGEYLLGREPIGPRRKKGVGARKFGEKHEHRLESKEERRRRTGRG